MPSSSPVAALTRPNIAQIALGPHDAAQRLIQALGDRDPGTEHHVRADAEPRGHRDTSPPV